MGTRLIFTVGTNPLPIWVAWFHLKNVLTVNEVQLVHTAGTVDEKTRLRQYCSGANFVDNDILTSPGDPGRVRGDVGVILDSLAPAINNLHIHYTGGTKVMSVETVAKLEYSLPTGVTLDTSYLDPRGAKGPIIVDSNGHTLVLDTRMDVTADLRRVAHLNGFTLAPFVHEYWDATLGKRVREECPAPAVLDENQETKGGTVLRRMKSRHAGRMASKHFEYAAYVALKEALEKIKTRNAKRENYKIFHSVNVRRTRVNQQTPHFELDVVAILGYQIIVVSCTLETGNALIKQKGMEVLLRARQLGGDEAQAIVLCGANSYHAQRLEGELHDEVGSAGAPLRVWGTDKRSNLSDHFHNYLRNDLHWT